MKNTHFTGERFIPDATNSEMEIEHTQRYLFAQNFVKGKIVLDAACGEGYGSNLLSEYAKEVFALDIDEKTILEASEKYSKPNLHFNIGTIKALPYEDNFFDVIVSFETIEHVNENIQYSFLTEIKRVLKPTGLLIISTPNRSIYTDLVNSKNDFHIKEFYYEEFKKFLETFFRTVQFYKQTFSLDYYITPLTPTTETGLFPLKTDARYFICICSIDNILPVIKNNYIVSDNQMYFYLFRRCNYLEKELLETKNESDKFHLHLTNDINKQKAYITELEKRLHQTKNEGDEFHLHLINDINNQKEYIKHLEHDLSQENENTQIIFNEKNEYIKQLEQEVINLRTESTKFSSQLEDNIKNQQLYIKHLENEVLELQENLTSLSDTKAQYINKLEDELCSIKKTYQLQKEELIKYQHSTLSLTEQVEELKDIIKKHQEHPLKYACKNILKK